MLARLARRWLQRSASGGPHRESDSSDMNLEIAVNAYIWLQKLVLFSSSPLIHETSRLCLAILMAVTPFLSTLEGNRYTYVSPVLLPTHPYNAHSMTRTHRVYIVYSHI